MVLFIPNFVNAEVIYSEYGNQSEFSEQEIIPNDTTLVETEERYKWYREVKEEGGYVQSDAKDGYFDKMDLNDFIYGDYEPWTEVLEDTHIKYDVEERLAYYYQNKKKIRYIYLTDVHGSNGSLRINEIIIKHKGVNVSYLTSGYLLNSNFNSYIRNGKIDENMSYIGNGGYLEIDLGNYYYLNDLDLEFYFYDRGTEVKSFKMIINDYPSSKDYIYELSFSNNFTNGGTHEVWPWFFKYEDFKIMKDEYSDLFLSLTEIDSNQSKLIKTVTEYRRRPIFYMIYHLNKEYKEGYHLSGDEVYDMIDVDDKKLFYRSYTRDYLKIIDDIVITDKQTDLSKFIQSNTNYKVDSNVDLSKNGEYTITIETPFTKYLKNVVVDIKENDDYKKQIEANQQVINSLNNQINETGQAVNNLNVKLEQKEEEKQYIIDTYEDVINEKNNELKNNEYKIEETKEIKQSSILHANSAMIISSLMIGLGLLILLFIYLTKRREN